MELELTIPAEGHLWANAGAFAILILISAFFAGAETALTGASRARMAALEKAGDRRAALVNKLRERNEALIGTLLFCNTFVGIFSSALATSVLIGIFGEKGVIVATLGVTILLLVFGEVMPKTYAIYHADRISLSLARPINLIVKILSPFIGAVTRFIDAVFKLFRLDRDEISSEQQEEELRGAIALAVDGGGESEKGAMLSSILDLFDVKVEEIMVHRKQIRMLCADWPVTRMVDEVLNSAYTRLPVWKGTPDNIVGVLHVKLLLNEWRRSGGDASRVNISNAMLTPRFIPESTTLYDQLQSFRKRREHFALIVDEYGALKGVLTLEDILEEIVGQIEDEYDTGVSGVHARMDGTYVVEGKVTIRDLNREFDWGLPDKDYATIAGLLIHETQRIPSVGQSFTFEGFRFDILWRQRNQITSVRITPPPKKGADPVDAAV